MAAVILVVAIAGVLQEVGPSAKPAVQRMGESLTSAGRPLARGMEKLISLLILTPVDILSFFLNPETPLIFKILSGVVTLVILIAIISTTGDKKGGGDVFPTERPSRASF